VRGDEHGDGLPLPAVTMATVVATIAFVTYSLSLLPGVDLGDTGGFQAAVLWPETSARQAYPLYFALGKILVRSFSPENPARGLNLFSALAGAAALGLLAYVAALVTRSILAGAAAALLLAFSYTFWTQAVIAEVYTLHLALVGACCVALHRYAARPTTTRLATFLAIYAASFGNHFLMILLLVPFAIFLLTVHPAPRSLFRPRILALATVIAASGALLYVSNFLFVWTNIDTPARWTDRVATFWFDTTKADWRDTMVLGVGSGDIRSHLAMWAWDARQQFGIAGLALALVGVVRLWIDARPWAWLVIVSYAVCTLFALTYNVGDSHVFFLTGHFFTALAMAGALGPGRRLAGRTPDDSNPSSRRGRLGPLRPAVWSIVTIAALGYSGWRAWDTWPSANRHDDRRADLLVARITTGVDDRSAVLVSKMDWQSENALLYSARYQRADLAWTRLADVMLHLPFFVRDNLAIGRDVVLTADAAAEITAAYGALFPIVQDAVPPVVPLAEAVEAIPRGTPYVLALLSPLDDLFDEQEFARTLTALTGGRAGNQRQAYQVWAGGAGEAPAYSRSSAWPFRESVSLLGDSFTIRMDAWLPFDTFRRGGFGHVLRGRDRLLIVERGVSLLWFAADGEPRVAYESGVYAPRPRFRIPASQPQQAGGIPDAMLRIAVPPG
jgi:hypothetical protein